MFFQNVKNVPSYHLINNPRKLSWLVDTLLKQKEFAFDIETNHPTNRGGRKPPGFVEVLSGISFAWGRGPEAVFKPGNVAYIPMAKEDDSPYWRSRQDAVVGVLREVLESDIPKTGQYAKFDMRKMFELYGVTTRNLFFDTHMAHVLLDENRGETSHALKSDYSKEGKVIKVGMSETYLDPSASSPKNDLDAALNHYDPDYRRYSKVPLDILHTYGCSDSDYTLALRYIFESRLKEEGLWWIFENIVMPLQTELTITELAGMPVDLETANRIKKEQEKLMEEYTLKAIEYAGKKFDVASPAQLGRILFEDLGLPGGRRNKQGWITDVDALEKVQHPVVEQILKFRRAQKIHGTYVVAALDRVEEITNENRIGFVHSKYYPDTVTGRLKNTDPPMTVLPRKENGGDIVKSIYMCPDDYRLIFMDYSQIELKVAAHVSQEVVWIEGFRKGIDLHALTAQKVFHPDKTVEDIQENYKSSRSDAKAVNFGIIYGRGAYSLSQALGITYEEAEHLINVDYFGALPILKSWIDTMHSQARDYGYVTNLFGRKRRLPEAQIEVPEYIQWPRRDGRPGCYCKGVSFERIGLLEKWRNHNGDWYDFVNNLDELEDIKGSIRSSGLDWTNKCLSCTHVFSCVVNTEIKRIKGIVNGALRMAQNAPIQSGASDLVALAWNWIGLELRRNELDSRIVLNVHDELIAMTHISQIDATVKIMKENMCDKMENYLSFTVPLTVDFQVVQRWSDK